MQKFEILYTNLQGAHSRKTVHAENERVAEMGFYSEKPYCNIIFIVSYDIEEGIKIVQIGGF